MTRNLMVGVAVLAMLAAAGCSDNGDGKGAEIRVHMENAGSFKYLNLGVREVTVTADGRPLQVEVAGKLENLLDPNNSPLLGTVRIPEGVLEIEVAIRLDDYGSFETDTEAGYIATRGAPIRFRAAQKEIRLHDHVVLHVDAARSILPGRSVEERIFLPNLNLRY